jgi:hypothetical protein
MSDQHQTNNRRAIILDIIVNRVMQNKEDDEGGVKFGRTTGPQLPAGIMLFFFGVAAVSGHGLTVRCASNGTQPTITHQNSCSIHPLQATEEIPKLSIAPISADKESLHCSGRDAPCIDKSLHCSGRDAPCIVSSCRSCLCLYGLLPANAFAWFRHFG